MRRTRAPTPPGVILRELYLAPRSISITAFADAVGCSRKHMSQIIHGKARIEASLAMRIGAVLGTSAELWLNLQNKLDLYHAQQKLKAWKPERVFHA
ncbi:MAG: HigA family addiction module antitoxin [Candidatus Bipolaricaulia bacterium]